MQTNKFVWQLPDLTLGANLDGASSFAESNLIWFVGFLDSQPTGHMSRLTHASCPYDVEGPYLAVTSQEKEHG